MCRYMKTSTCSFSTPDHRHLFHQAHYHWFQDRDSPIAAGWFGLTHGQLRAAALHLTTSCRRAGQARSGCSTLAPSIGSSHFTTPLHCRPQRVLHYRQIHAYVEFAIGHCHLLPPPSGASTAPRLSNSELLYTVQSSAVQPHAHPWPMRRQAQRARPAAREPATGVGNAV
jgi:hypothetical protein